MMLEARAGMSAPDDKASSNRSLLLSLHAVATCLDTLLMTAMLMAVSSLVVSMELRD